MKVTETQLQYILFIQKHEAVDLFPAVIFHIGGSLQYSLQSLQLPSTYIDGTAGEKLTGGGIIYGENSGKCLIYFSRRRGKREECM
jgi:hypothetical protein